MARARALPAGLPGSARAPAGVVSQWEQLDLGLADAVVPRDLIDAAGVSHGEWPGGHVARLCPVCAELRQLGYRPRLPPR